MNKKQFLTVFLLLALVCLVSSKKRIYYLFTDETEQDKLTIETLKQNSQNHPVYKVDCNKHDCTKFKATHYPSLIFWNGPGTSYKSLYPTNHEGLQAYFKAKEQHILKDIRDFMQRISLLQAFGVAIIAATILYFIFSALFKDRSGLQQAQNKKDL